MSETPTEKKFNKLLKRIFENFVFYIPAHAKQTLNATDEQFEFLEPYINKVYIFDKMKGPILYDVDNRTLFSSQAGLLSKNRFALIDYKEKLAPLAFNFIFQDYCKLANLFKSYSKWMFDELANSSELPQRELYSGTLKLQFTYLEQHCNDLITISTYLNDAKKQSISTKDILESLAINFDFNPPKESQNTDIDITPFSDFSKKLLKQEPFKKKERVSIDEQKIETFLLKSHFNVKM